MHPDNLDALVKEVGIAYMPLGICEHHGYHLPVGFDGIKAHEILRLVAEKMGGVVFPTLFFGTGGGHADFPYSVMIEHEVVRNILDHTLSRMSDWGFRLVVVFSGHYPSEQVRMVRDAVNCAKNTSAGTDYLGYTDLDLYKPLPGDRIGEDHAGKYETSLALAMNEEWVKMHYMNRRTDDSAADEKGVVHNPRSPRYAIYGGSDPRREASRALGEKLLKQMVTGIVADIKTVEKLR